MNRAAALVSLLVIALIANSATMACAAERIMLRSLDILREPKVVRLDEDGIVLAAPRAGGSKLITWDEVEQGTIANQFQPQFDSLLKEIGLPLYRLRQRLRVGDYAGLRGPAEQLYPRFATRQSETAYMVCQSLMWARLAMGERERAVEPYLRCYELLRSRAARIASIPGERRLQVDPQTGLSAELVPIWFDAAAAKKVLPAVKTTCEALAQPRPPAAGLYYATLALAAGETAEAEQFLARLPTEPEAIGQWRMIALAQAEILAGKTGTNVAELSARRDDFTKATRPAAIYWLGMASLSRPERETQLDGLLDLLTLDASYGQSHPELAAAGLYQAMLALDKLKDDAGSAAVRQELLQRYAGTAQAAKVRGRAKLD
jgi:hypothetical protein